MRAFNLDEALSGHPVQMRNGNVIKQLKMFYATAKLQPCLYGVDDMGIVWSWYKDGTFLFDGQHHPHDLVMMDIPFYTMLVRFPDGKFSCTNVVTNPADVIVSDADLDSEKVEYLGIYKLTRHP